MNVRDAGDIPSGAGEAGHEPTLDGVVADDDPQWGSMQSLAKRSEPARPRGIDDERLEPEALAHAVADGLKRPVLSRDVEAGGAGRAAAATIAELL